MASLLNRIKKISACLIIKFLLVYAIQAKANELVMQETTLRDLRLALKITQHDIRQILHMTQDEILRLEKHTDMLLFTLNNNISAMSGKLKITADSAEEGLAFLSQLFNEQDNEELKIFRDRIIVFSKPGVFPSLAQRSQTFIPVVFHIRRKTFGLPHLMHDYLRRALNEIFVILSARTIQIICL
ncbi:MAG: hypothetical protein Q8R83_00935 [Legionellaceae bacterium]|nr:hypothetical protein [Legionellaceae bacterium]